MIPLFCKGILNSEYIEKNELNPEDLLINLQKLFKNLKGSKKPYYSPVNVLNSIKDPNNKSLNINAQYDPIEFFKFFIDQLEQCLKLTNNPNLVNNVFIGIVNNEIIGIKCGHKQINKENFFSLDLKIISHKDMKSALAGYISEEELTGTNSHFCDKCGKKVNAKKKILLEVLPNVLLVNLNRSELDDTQK